MAWLDEEGASADLSSWFVALGRRLLSPALQHLKHFLTHGSCIICIEWLVFSADLLSCDTERSDLAAITPSQ